jgi:hypothetical protein
MRSNPFRQVLHIGLISGFLISPVWAQSMVTDTAAQLNFLASQRVLFGHQSVGSNILSGVSALAVQSRVDFPVHEIRAGDVFKQNGLGHVYVAENNQPLRKIESFEQALSQPGSIPKVAALKFCYVDVHAGTDVRQLFDAYQRMATRLEAKHPHLKLVHITVPLTTVQTGWKASVKRVLGKAPYGVLENMRREEYNQLLRQTYGQTGTVFDLARVEATLPDGRMLTADWKGQQVPVLVPSYSDDGEHLAGEGQLHVARHFVAALAHAAR